MSNRKVKILVVSGVVALGLLVGSGIFVWRSKEPKKTNQEKEIKDNFDDKNEPVSNHPNSDAKKSLFREIKNEITAELEQIKNAKNIAKINEILDSGFIVAPNGIIWKDDEQKKASPTELETVDYNEIVSLIKVKRREVVNNRKVEIEKEIEEKLANQPDLFYCPVQVSKTSRASDWYGWRFSARENNRTYHLIIPRGHRSLANISLKAYRLYQITGINSPLLETYPEYPDFLVKKVELNNQITIKLIEN